MSIRWTNNCDTEASEGGNEAAGLSIVDLVCDSPTVACGEVQRLSVLRHICAGCNAQGKLVTEIAETKLGGEPLCGQKKEAGVPSHVNIPLRFQTILRVRERNTSWQSARRGQRTCIYNQILPGLVYGLRSRSRQGHHAGKGNSLANVA